MSFDLAFWYERAPSSPEQAQGIYQALAGSDSVTGLVEPTSRVGDFYDDVVGTYPELSGTDDIDESPWMSELHHTAECVVVAISWSRSAEIKMALLSIAGRHGLTTYDPQHCLVHSPPAGDDADITVVNELDQKVGDPSPAQLRTMLDQLTRTNQFLIMSRTASTDGQHYAQVWFEHAEHYDVEYRDGSADQHYGAVARDLATVHAVVTGWAAQSPGWQDTLPWRRVVFD